MRRRSATTTRWTPATSTRVRSISDTWLRFPVGTGYAYSNLGPDLAGYILEKTYGEPFAAVMRDLLLKPLGMNGSTFDRAQIRETVNRAVGHASPLPVVPLDVPMTAAGGLYTSANDLARFLRFQLNGGSVDGQAVLIPARSRNSVRFQLQTPGPDTGARSASVARAGMPATMPISSATAVVASASSPTSGGCPSSRSGSRS